MTLGPHYHGNDDQMNEDEALRILVHVSRCGDGVMRHPSLYLLALADY